jgi:hypothetical protein
MIAQVSQANAMNNRSLPARLEAAKALQGTWGHSPI